MPVSLIDKLRQVPHCHLRNEPRSFNLDRIIRLLPPNEAAESHPEATIDTKPDEPIPQPPIPDTLFPDFQPQ